MPHDKQPKILHFKARVLHHKAQRQISQENGFYNNPSITTWASVCTSVNTHFAWTDMCEQTGKLPIQHKGISVLLCWSWYMLVEIPDLMQPFRRDWLKK